MTGAVEWYNEKRKPNGGLDVDVVLKHVHEVKMTARELLDATKADDQLALSGWEDACPQSSGGFVPGVESPI